MRACRTIRSVPDGWDRGRARACKVAERSGQSASRLPFFQRLPFAIAAAHCLPDRFHRFKRGTEAALFCYRAADLSYSLLQTSWRLGAQPRLTPAVARVAERIRLLE